MARRANVTPVDELPTMNELDGPYPDGFNNMLPPGVGMNGPDNWQPSSAGYDLALGPNQDQGMQPHNANTRGPYSEMSMPRERQVHSDQVRKHIRMSSAPMPQSGMADIPPGHTPVGPMMQAMQFNLAPGPNTNQKVSEQFLPPLSCLDIAGHIQDCPICSKFYSQDRTVYIILIVILAVTALLLLKKVLGV